MLRNPIVSKPLWASHGVAGRHLSGRSNINPQGQDPGSSSNLKLILLALPAQLHPRDGRRPRKPRCRQQNLVNRIHRLPLPLRSPKQAKPQSGQSLLPPQHAQDPDRSPGGWRKDLAARRQRFHLAPNSRKIIRQARCNYIGNPHLAGWERVSKSQSHAIVHLNALTARPAGRGGAGVEYQRHSKQADRTGQGSSQHFSSSIRLSHIRSR